MGSDVVLVCLIVVIHVLLNCTALVIAVHLKIDVQRKYRQMRQ